MHLLLLIPLLKQLLTLPSICLSVSLSTVSLSHSPYLSYSFLLPPPSQATLPPSLSRAAAPCLSSLPCASPSCCTSPSPGETSQWAWRCWRAYSSSMCLCPPPPLPLQGRERERREWCITRQPCSQVRRFVTWLGFVFHYFLASLQHCYSGITYYQ